MDNVVVNDELPDWDDLAAPSLETFEALAQRAYEGLPDRVRALCTGLIIRIEDFPDDETLDAMKCESEFDLLGLFQGQGLAQGEAFSQTGMMPNMVWLYRRPILDYWAGHDETLGAIVRHVLIHEIGHHFGLSDDDIDAIEASD